MFISISTLQKETLKIFNRFPVTVLLSILGTLSGILLTLDSNYSNENLHMRILLMVMLGGAASIAAHLFNERRQSKSVASLLILLVSVALPWFYAFYCSDISNPPFTEILRHFVLMAGVHFLVAVAPFFGSNEMNAFWQFNKTIFLRFLLSTLYAFVIYVGVSVALLAISGLFDFVIDSQFYFQMWIFTVGIIQTWFFLSGIPQDLTSLNADQNYPRSLRVFAQYVLLPLSVAYLAILYAYSIKLLWSMSLPLEFGWFVSIFSAISILTLLFLHPYQYSSESSWIKRTISMFYGLNLPLAALIFVSVYLRIVDFGFTESRYYLLVLGFWLVVISLYFLISKVRDIRFIPLTLAVLAFGTSFGFWGASGVSLSSQIARLQNYLKAPIETRNNNEIYAILDYITEEQYLASASKMMNIDLGKNLVTASKALGVNYVNKWDRNRDNYILPGFSYLSAMEFTYTVPQSTQFKYFHSYHGMADVASDATGLDTRMDPNPNSKQLVVFENGKELTRLDLTEFMKYVEKHDNIKEDTSQNNIITANLLDRRVTVILTSIEIKTEQNLQTRISSAVGYIFITPF